MTALTAAVRVRPAHAPWYPMEPKDPHRHCDCCGQFLRWDDWNGRYLDHVAWDDYMGAWEGTC